MSSIFKFFIEGVCTSLLGISGIVGNLVSIAVLSASELDMMPSFRHLLKMLAAFDATFLIFTLALFGISPWSDHYDQFIKPWLIPYFLPIIQISLTGSVWTTMAVSVERYLTVCLCYRGPSMPAGVWKWHFMYTLPILGFSIIFNIPRFFELRTEFNFVNQTIYNESLGENVTEEVKHPVVSPTEFRENLEYSRDYVLIANSVALGFIPILTLIVLNSCIFRTISKATQRHNAISSNQRRDHSVAMMLIFIVAVFVVCHSIRSIINTYECIQFAMNGKLLHWPEWIQMLVHVNHFALVVNSSINILIYCCKDEKFLNVMLETLGFSRFLRRPVNSQTQNRGPNGHMPQTELAIARSPRPQIELQTVVRTSSNHFEPKVTTALLSTEKVSMEKSTAKEVTVVEINNEKEPSHSKTVRITDEGGSSLALDASLHCEECCRCCSCGETVSSADDSALEDILEHQPENKQSPPQKSSISTQTSISSTTQPLVPENCM